MSEFLNEIISFTLPDGLPSEQEIRELAGNQDEIDKLFSAQKQIIFDFKNAVSAEFTKLEAELRRVRKMVNAMEEEKSETRETKIVSTKKTTRERKAIKEKTHSYTRVDSNSELIRYSQNGSCKIRISINNGKTNLKPKFVPSGRPIKHAFD